MRSEAFRIAMQPINHEINFVRIYVMVSWQQLLSETLMVYCSVPPKFVAVRHQRSDLIEAKP